MGIAIFVFALGQKLQKQVFSYQQIKKIPKNQNNNQQCEINIEKRIVRGSSLEPLIKNGQEIKILLNYYQCNQIKRNDIVLYSYAGNSAPLIKIVKGIPGDSFRIIETGKGGWYILINGEILRNFENKPYLISDRRKFNLLRIYEKSYQGKIPEGAYLLLGNLIYGSLDSTQFGFVEKKDIIGKVVY